jgi:hypothetical protein
MIVCASTVAALALACPPMPVDVAPASAPTGEEVDAPPSSASSPAPLVPEPWATLADCESGDWIDGGATFVEGSARWDWGAPGMQLPPWGTDLHHGGLQFAPSTWTWVAPDVLDQAPVHAYDATPAEQIQVAEEVLARQGWDAWPVCSRLIGARS